MANSTGQLDSNMQHWLFDHACSPSIAMRQLWEATQQLEDAEMLTSPEQLQFLAFLASSISAKTAIEIGVYTGASALAIAEVLPEDGKLIACDCTDEYLQYAAPAWEQAGVQQIIEMHIGPALETLQSLLDEGKTNSFDFMYIDADKINSKNYYEYGLQLLRSGGIIAIDNMFYGGQVTDESHTDENTVATRELAAFLLQDERVTYSLIPIGDGLAIALLS
jgi:predicted O-methyltransferase YrrM